MVVRLVKNYTYRQEDYNKSLNTFLPFSISTTRIPSISVLKLCEQDICTFQEVTSDYKKGHSLRFRVT